MAKIKLTNINPTDTKGGASLAGYRLHKELLLDPEIDSVLFVNAKYTQDEQVFKFSNFFLWQIERILSKVGYFTGLLYLLSVNWLPLLFFKRFRQTDVFLIRSIHGGFLPFWFPWWLSKRAPVIWRFPDMWALTGHCVFAYSCPKWQKECFQCPLLKDYPALFLDTSRLLFRWKKYFYGRSNLYLVAPSQWMLENIKKSPILNQFPRFYIPIGIDIELFKPGVRREKLTLIIVSGSLKDKRKGAEVLPHILIKLNQGLRARNVFVDILWVGEKDISVVELNKLNNINNIFLGHKKESELAEYYGQSHLHILPTLADNLPNTIIESLACQTPVVVFDIGGCSDAVKHLKTGYLAKPADIDDFVLGILYFLDDPKALEACGLAGRELVKKQFTSQLQAQRYKNLIKQAYQENQRNCAVNPLVIARSVSDEAIPVIEIASPPKAGRNDDCSFDMNTQKGGLWLQNIYKHPAPGETLVSVVMPVFNNEHTLAGAIESVLAQTYPHIEFIIIDGGSTDGTLDIIRKYESQIDYWQSEPDKGIADAMNKGVKAAHGGWIHILNSDDYYASPDCVNKAIQVIGKPQNVFYYFTLHFLESSGKIREQKYPFNWLNRWKLYYSAYIAHPVLFVSREQYKTVDFYDDTYKICGDHDLILKLCQRFKGCFVDIPMTVMRPGGVSERNMVKTFGEFKKATVKAGLPSWLAEIIFRFKLWKYNLRRKQ